MANDTSDEKNAPLKNWIIQYIFSVGENDSAMSVVKVQAPSYEAACKLAQEKAVAEEFIFSVHPESEEQFLGKVRRDIRARTQPDQSPYLIDLEEIFKLKD